MKHLYEPATAEAVKARIARLRPERARQWGRMDAAQMLAHCTAGFAMARGEIAPRACSSGACSARWRSGRSSSGASQCAGTA